MNPEACYLRLALLHPEVLDLHPVDPSRFLYPKQAKALRALVQLHADGRGGYHELDAIMGQGFCSSLPEITDFADNAAGLVTQIQDRTARSIVIGTLNRLQEGLKDPLRNTKDLISEAVGALLDAQDQAEQVDTFRQVIQAGFARVEKVYESGGILGLPTGWAKLDEVIGGWEPDKLYFVAGRPGAGKTAFGLQAAVEAARNGANVYVSSQEMGQVQVAMRVLSQEARVSAERMRVAKLSDSDWPKLTHAAGTLVDLPGWFDTRTGISFDQLRSSVLRAHAKQPVGLVLVDYVQMLRGKGESKVYELETIAYGLKALAKELQAPVICLSQLNREAEAEDEGKGRRSAPGVSKMRGSGGLEQAADVVVILWQPDPKNQPNTVEVRVAKHRDGRTGKFNAEFSREWTRFE